MIAALSLFILLLLCGLAIFLYWQYSSYIISRSLTQNNDEYVVLLHGLAGTSISMQKLAKKLAQTGYRVINIDYPTRSASIEDLAENTLKKKLLERYTDRSKKINFVTHSMGGIMVRCFLANNKLENINRVVMISPPNKGSEVADKASCFKTARRILGPALVELTTGKGSFVSRLPLPDYECGIIAGKYDELVPVERTKLDNMTDFVIVPTEHALAANDDKVISLVLNFLAKGKF